MDRKNDGKEGRNVIPKFCCFLLLPASLSHKHLSHPLISRDFSMEWFGSKGSPTRREDSCLFLEDSSCSLASLLTSPTVCTFNPYQRILQSISIFFNSKSEHVRHFVHAGESVQEDRLLRLDLLLNHQDNDSGNHDASGWDNIQKNRPQSLSHHWLATLQVGINIINVVNPLRIKSFQPRLSDNRLDNQSESGSGCAHNVSHAWFGLCHGVLAGK